MAKSTSSAMRRNLVAQPVDEDVMQLPRSQPIAGGEENADPNKNMANKNAPDGDGKKAPSRRRKRQLKLDDMKNDSALPHIYTNFYENFRKKAKGKGHEVGDLSRLIQMYYR